MFIKQRSTESQIQLLNGKRANHHHSWHKTSSILPFTTTQMTSREGNKDKGGKRMV